MKLFFLLVLSISFSQLSIAQLYDEYYLKGVGENHQNLYPQATTGAGNGNVLVTGYIVKNANSRVPYICKFNNAGGMDWIYEYLHNDDEHPAKNLKPVAITVTYPYGNIVITGNTFNPSDTDFDHPLKPFVIKLAPNGHHIYTRFYDCQDITGSYQNDCSTFVANDIISDLNEGIKLVGYTVMEDDNNKNGIIMPLNSAGYPNISLTTSYYHPNYGDTEIVKIKSLTDGGYIILLKHHTPAHSSYANELTSLMRLNSSFQPIWSKHLLYNENTSYLPHGLEIANGGEKIYVLGYQFNKPYITQLTIDGDVNWTKSYIINNHPLSDWQYSVPELGKDLNNNLYISFNLWRYDGSGNIKNFVIKTSGAGLVLWGKAYGDYSTNHTIIMKDIAIIYDGAINSPEDLVQVGYLKSNNPNNSSSLKIRIRTNNGSTDCHHESNAVQMDEIPYVSYTYEAGVINTTPFSTPQNMSRNDPSFGFSKCNGFFIPDSEGDKTIIAQNEHKNQLAIFPNPNNGDFNLSIPYTGLSQVSEIEVFNFSGKLIRQFTADHGQQDIQLSGLAKGSYIIRWTQGSETAVQRVIVQ